MQQLQGLDWPVTESWISFAKASVTEEPAIDFAGSRIQQLLNSGIFSAFDTTTVTENPEERRRLQEIADAQVATNSATNADGALRCQHRKMPAFSVYPHGFYIAEVDFIS